jgi:hypothetical protein
VAAQVGAQFADADRAAVQRWADEHPLDHLPFTRTSPTSAQPAQRIRASAGNVALGVHRTRDAQHTRSLGPDEDADQHRSADGGDSGDGRTRARDGATPPRRPVV